MIFVHGFPEFWYSWRHQIKEFSKDYWVVAVDMRGYNESDKPKGLNAYKIDLLADDIKALLGKLGKSYVKSSFRGKLTGIFFIGREKFTLVAHDWGAVISWHFVSILLLF